MDNFFFINLGFLSSAKQDECLSLAQECVKKMENKSCFIDLFLCQGFNFTNITDVSGTTAMVSALEARAVLREYLNNPEILDKLPILSECRPPKISTEHLSEEIAVKTDETPSSIEQPRADLLKTIANGAIYAFIHNLFEKYLTHKKFNPTDITHYKIAVSIALVSASYALSLLAEEDKITVMMQMTAAIALSLLSNVSYLTKNSMIKNIINGAIFSAGLITEGPTKLLTNTVVGTAGSYVGSYLANSMANALRWSKANNDSELPQTTAGDTHKIKKR